MNTEEKKMLSKMQTVVQSVPADTAAKTSLAIGTGGSAAQLIMEWSSVVVMGGNAVLVVGGIYLMYHKIFDDRKNRRKGDK